MDAMWLPSRQSTQQAFNDLARAGGQAVSVFQSGDPTYRTEMSKARC